MERNNYDYISHTPALFARRVAPFPVPNVRGTQNLDEDRKREDDGFLVEFGLRNAIKNVGVARMGTSAQSLARNPSLGSPIQWAEHDSVYLTETRTVYMIDASEKFMVSRKSGAIVFAQEFLWWVETWTTSRTVLEEPFIRFYQLFRHVENVHADLWYETKHNRTNALKFQLYFGP
jgi:hypothetical protein